MATTPTSAQVDPESLVGRIITELQANPEAQKLLLRVLLTDEFLGMPVRLERVEDKVEVIQADVDIVKSDLDVVKSDLDVVKSDLDVVKSDVAVLKGDSLEGKLHRRIRPLLSQRLKLRRARVMQSPLRETRRELFEPVEEAFDRGVISDSQETRIDATDIIVHATRKEDRSQVWVAVEASNNIGQSDIERVRQSADALGAIFQQDTIAMVAGYHIHPLDQERADSMNVHAFLIEENS